ncbi:MAG: ornithine carbamoyltransferase [Actinobacteria bacterium]|nr:ornithine carbamoyltransferase [Actinomycetota bacterium]
MTRNLLELDDLSVDEFARIIALAEAGGVAGSLQGSSAALVFEKPSARTRNATELAVHDLDGYAVVIYDQEVGIDSRESAEDVARTLAAFHDLICIRVRDHEVLTRMASSLEAHGMKVPLVNLLSDRAHPCQALADLLTLRELFAASGAHIHALAGKTVAWVGDANNVAASLIHACLMANISVRLAAPEAFQFSQSQMAAFAARAQAISSSAAVTQFSDPKEAVQGVVAIATDVWTSMGQEAERADRLKAFAGFNVDEALMAAAAPEAIFLHCLPAHRGEEVSEAVLEAPYSAVWRQVFHRRTAMLGIFSWLAEVNR